MSDKTTELKEKINIESSETKNEPGGAQRTETQPVFELAKQPSLIDQERKQVISEISSAENDLMNSAMVQTSQQKILSEREEEIEKILEKDLAEIYLSLTPDEQEEFAIKGEKTAKKINAILDTAKIKVSEVIKLIKEWLKLIPAVNIFFLEQEAKIRADEIIHLIKKH